MPNHDPDPKMKFTFGLWTVGNSGADPFGGSVRERISRVQIANLFGEVGAYGVNFQDDDFARTIADGATHNAKRSPQALGSGLQPPLIESAPGAAGHSDPSRPVPLGNVWVIHGRSQPILQAACVVVAQMGYNPVLLDQLPIGAGSFRDKLTMYVPRLCYAVCVFAAEDRVSGPSVGDERAAAQEDGANPNVLYETAWAEAVLGPRGMCVLHEQSVKIPTVMHSVLYIDVDRAGRWRVDLALAMRHAGLSIDLNRLYPQVA